MARQDELRTAILARLADERQYHLLTEIHLEEEIGRALEMVAQVRASGQGWWRLSTTLPIRVAEAAEESHPHEAIRLYLAEVERLIAARGRGNYAEAVTYLARVRDLHHRLGEQKT